MTDTNGTTAAEIDRNTIRDAVVLELVRSNLSNTITDAVIEAISLAPPVVTDAVQIDNAVTDLLTTMLCEFTRDGYGIHVDPEDEYTRKTVAKVRHDLDECGYAIVDKAGTP
jgi:hypothetical protein